MHDLALLASRVSCRYGDIVPVTNSERIVAVLCQIVGVLFFNYILASIAATVANSDKNLHSFQRKIDGIKLFLKVSKIIWSFLQHVIIIILCFDWLTG